MGYDQSMTAAPNPRDEYRQYRYAPTTTVPIKSVVGVAVIVSALLLFAAVLYAASRAYSTFTPDGLTRTIFLSAVFIIVVSIFISACISYVIGIRRFQSRLRHATYTIENGALVFRTIIIVDFGFISFNRPQFRRWELSGVTAAKIGNMLHPERLRMLLEWTGGRQIVILTLENMDAFITEVARNISVEIEKMNEDLPCTTKIDIVLSFIIIALMLASIACLVYWSGFSN